MALADVFTGTDGPDAYKGPVEDDLVTGLGAGDFLQGDPTPYGAGGDDFVSVGDGDDRVYGNSGDDYVSGGRATTTSAAAWVATLSTAATETTT